MQSIAPTPKKLLHVKPKPLACSIENVEILLFLAILLQSSLSCTAWVKAQVEVGYGFVVAVVFVPLVVMPYAAGLVKVYSVFEQLAI